VERMLNPGEGANQTQTKVLKASKAPRWGKRLGTEKRGGRVDENKIEPRHLGGKEETQKEKGPSKLLKETPANNRRSSKGG